LVPRECDSVEVNPAVDGPGGKPPLPKLSSAFSQVFSFPVLLAFGLAVLAVVSVSNRFNDPDLWWHLKVGEVVWNTHAIPRTDTFSFTTNGHAWTAHEWLAQLSIYAAYSLAATPASWYGSAYLQA
jgi:hypothetical protein